MGHFVGNSGQDRGVHGLPAAFSHSRIRPESEPVAKRFRMSVSSPKDRPPASLLRRRRRAISLAAVLLLLLLAPRLLTHTPMRSWLLSAIVGKRDLLVQAGAASGGWLQPLSFEQVSLLHTAGSLECTIGKVQTGISLLQYLISPPDSFAVSANSVQLTVHIDEEGRWPTLDSDGRTVERLRWAITEGTLVLTVPWRPVPLINLQQLAISGRIEPDSHGHRQLEIDACRLLDHTPLDDSHAQQNLALVAPVLSQTTNITGSASLALDALRIPLDGVEEFSPFPLRGTVVLHQLQAKLTEQILQQVTDAFGKLPVTLPAQITAPRESRIAFEVSEAGIRHQQMRFGFKGLTPAVQIATSGILRLDETIQLTLSLQAGWAQLLRPPWNILANLGLQRFSMRATGSVDAPVLQSETFAETSEPESNRR